MRCAGPKTWSKPVSFRPRAKPRSRAWPSVSRSRSRLTMAALIDPADPADPIARQFVPDGRELEDRARGECRSDRRSSLHAGEGHRPSLSRPRAAEAAHVCPVYCRFCFRREDVGPGSETLTAAELDAALDYIRARPAIWEVIVTGGDPFLMSPRRLKAIVAALEAIPHVGVIRFHTRVPIVAPERVDAALVRGAGQREGALRRDPRQPSARADAGGASSGQAPQRGRHPAPEPVGAAERRQ